MPNKPLVSGGGAPLAGADQTEAGQSEADCTADHAVAGHMEFAPIATDLAVPPAASARGRRLTPAATAAGEGPGATPDLAGAAADLAGAAPDLAGAAADAGGGAGDRPVDPAGDVASDVAGDGLFPLPRPAPVPVLRQAARVELAVAARTCPPLARARRLALWVGTGRPVTTAGVLAAPAAAEAIHVLGLRPPADDPELDARQQSMFAVPERDTGDQARRSVELSTVWDLALDVGFLTVGASTVRPGPGIALWPDGGNDAVLRIWSDALKSAVRRVHDGDPAPPSGALRRETRSALEPLRETDSLTLADLRAGLVRQAARNGLGDELRAWTERCGDPLGPLLGCLIELGAVRLSGDRAGFTALGGWAWRTLAPK